MASLEYLQKLGWYISPEGYNLISKEGSLKDVQIITQTACDIDIKEFGSAVLTKDLDTLTGPIVLQIQKLRNISAPKANETSASSPRLLKLILTDGHTTCQAIEYESLSNLSLSTPPGTKILLKNVQIIGSYIVMKNVSIKILGGHVATLVERWQLSRSITKHIREGSDGPPPWVPFGQKVSQSVTTDKNFKSLDSGKNKEQTKDEFEAQREEAIAEAAQGAVRKTFGGFKAIPLKDNQHYTYNKKQPIRNQNDEKKSSGKIDTKKKGKEKETTEVLKPSGKISLFAFLEDKLPTTSVEFDKNKQETEQLKSKSVKPMYAEKYDASLRHRGNDNPPQKTNRNTEKNESKDYKNHINDRYSRSYNEKAPRFQKQLQQKDNIGCQSSLDEIIKKTDKLNFNNSSVTNYKKNKNFTPPTMVEKSGRESNVSPFQSVSTNKTNKQENYNSSMENKTNPSQNFFSANKFQQSQQLHSPFTSRNYNTNYGGHLYYNEQNNLPVPSTYRSGSYEQNNRQPYQNQSSFSQYSQVGNSNSPNRFQSPSQSFTNSNVKNSTNSPLEWNWKVGDQCLAKYWEDNQFYNASITDVTPRTCMVQFKDYGNFEEVLKADCLPLLTNNTVSNYNNNRQFTGTLVFRRGGNGSHLNDHDRSNSNNFRKNNYR